MDSVARCNQSITMNSPSVVRDAGRRKLPASILPDPIPPPSPPPLLPRLTSTREVTEEICGRPVPPPTTSDEDDADDGGEHMVNSGRAFG